MWNCRHSRRLLHLQVLFELPRPVPKNYELRVMLNQLPDPLLTRCQRNRGQCGGELALQRVEVVPGASRTLLICIMSARCPRYLNSQATYFKLLLSLMML